MIYARRYLQYNRLVFDHYEMISTDGVDVSFKGNSTPYSFGHGSYRPFKRSYSFLEEQEVSLTLKMYLNKLPCEYRRFYVDFAKSELVKQGRLWAVQGNTLVWAYAEVTGMHEQPTQKDNYAEIDVDFVIPEGVWHKADGQKTFLRPYNVCTYLDCFNFKDMPGCECCDCSDTQDYACLCCDCDELTEDMLLCKHKNLDFSECFTPYEIIYDCDKANQFADDFVGQRICSDCNGIIAGQLYSNTDIPTTELGIVLDGNVHDPAITINGNTNIIKGEYDGTLYINSSGDVIFQNDMCETLLSPAMWSIPSGNEYGWTINPRNNSIIIETNSCCTTCAWIQVDAITA